MESGCHSLQINGEQVTESGDMIYKDTMNRSWNVDVMIYRLTVNRSQNPDVMIYRGMVIIPR